MTRTDDDTTGRTVVLCATGASGAVLAHRFLKLLLAHRDVDRVHFAASEAFGVVLREEEDLDPEAALERLPSREKLRVHRPGDLAAPIASGSFPAAATVILPASMATVGAIASGAGRNLIHRAAEVALKEERPLIIAPRETPLSLIHLRNLTRLREAGARIIPFMPAFYPRPQTIDDLVDHFLQRLLDHLSLDNDLSTRWS